MDTEEAPRSDSEELTGQLRFLQDDYTAENKSPFKRFYCPIMARDDENAELCLGHVVNKEIPNSSRAKIVQRKDVDGFYGRLFEPDFVALQQVRNRPKNDLLFDPKLRKKVKPKIIIDGEECDFYENRGQTVPPHHYPITLKCQDGGELKVVIKKTPEEMSDKPRQFSVLVDYDCRVEALASLIKAAYLTLFRMLGYRYALSAAGFAVGYTILGDFFRQYGHMSTFQASDAAREYFRPYVNMVRPVDNYDGVTRSGTIENSQGMLCATKNGRMFGMVVNVRTGNILTGVLMPGFNDVWELTAYLDFLKNDEEHVRLHHCKFAEDKKSINAETTSVETLWPKKDVSFDLK